MAVDIDIPTLPLEIDRFMRNRPKNRIHKIGVELEGAWKPGAIKPKRDSSVFKDLKDKKSLLKLTEMGLAHPQLVGEVQSDAIVPCQLVGWMKKSYPTYSDETCGLHIHMSFESLWDYGRLMNVSYPVTMVAYLKQFAAEENLPLEHQLWKRLANESEYCQHGFWPDKQIIPKQKDFDHHRKGHRYTAINYPWGRFKTIECRVLPMFETVDQATRALKRVMDITNACLIVLAKKEAKLKETFIGPEIKGIVEHDIEVI